MREGAWGPARAVRHPRLSPRLSPRPFLRLFLHGNSVAGPAPGWFDARMKPSLPQGYEISSSPDRLDRALIHRWLSTDAYWAVGRPRELQEAAIEGSLNFGVYETATGSQVGYARVVTDRATFAWLCDVYVAPELRGRGLGNGLVAAVRDEVAALGVYRIMLATADAHEVYARAGFAPLEEPGKWMVLGRA
nr:acetyltransferase [Streptomyces tsukubensis NRRL18488]